MNQPPRYVHPNYPNHICTLQKALYGLKQAPRAWFSKLTSKLISLGFKGCRSDTSLFIYKNHLFTMYILIYVDDILITCSNSSAIIELISLLGVDFGIKDLGSLNFFLGIEVLPHENGVLLSQRRYILDLLKKTNMLEAKPFNTPMAASTSLSALMELLMKTPHFFVAQLEGCNTWLLHSLTLPLLLINSLSSCTAQLLLIGKLLNAFSNTSNIHSILVFTSNVPMFLSFKHTAMLNRQVLAMTEDQLVAIAFILALISSLGVARNKLL